MQFNHLQPPPPSHGTLLDRHRERSMHLMRGASERICIDVQGDRRLFPGIDHLQRMVWTLPSGMRPENVEGVFLAILELCLDTPPFLRHTLDRPLCLVLSQEQLP